MPKNIEKQTYIIKIYEESVIRALWLVRKDNIKEMVVKER